MTASLTRRSTLAALAAGGLLMLGIGSAALAAPSAATVPVTVKEFAVQTAPANATAGQVTFQVINQGAVAHELVVIRTDKPVDGLALEADGTEVAEEADGQKSVGEVEDVDPGTTKEGALDLAPGRYVLICNIPGHYQAGMRAELMVAAPGGAAAAAPSAPASLPSAGADPTPYAAFAAGGLALLGAGLGLRGRLSRR